MENGGRFIGAIEPRLSSLHGTNIASFLREPKTYENGKQNWQRPG